MMLQETHFSCQVERTIVQTVITVSQMPLSASSETKSKRYDATTNIFAAKSVRKTFKTTAPQVPLILCPQLDQKMKQRVKV